MGEYLRPMSDLISEAARKISEEETSARMSEQERRERWEANRSAPRKSGPDPRIVSQVKEETQRAFKAARHARLGTDANVREAKSQPSLTAASSTYSYHKGWQVTQWRGETKEWWDSEEDEMRSSTPTKELVLEKGSIFRATAKLCIQEYGGGNNTYSPTSVESIVGGHTDFGVEDVRMGLARIIALAGE